MAKDAPWGDDPAYCGDDPYDVLGVRAGASSHDIVRAYHRAARESHPDARPADPRAAGRFRAITEAYALLSDADRRAEYDRGRSGRPNVAPSPPPPQPPGRPRGMRPDPPLWAGPVHIQPASEQPARDGVEREHAAEAYALLEWYVNRIWGWR